MAPERQPRPEQQPERGRSIENAAAERLRELERKGEHEPNKEKAVEAAREQLQQVEHTKPAAEAAPASEPARPILTRAVNYRQTMVSLRHRLRPASRSFSKLIHSPVVETTSEVLEKTVMRPSVSLGATVSAVVITGGLYIYARFYGFELRGSEIWLSLIVGAIIGLIAEALYRTVRRARPRE